MSQQPFSLEQIRHPHEASRRTLATVTTVVTYLIGLAVIVVSPILGLILIILIVSLWFGISLWRARLLGGAVKVTEESFPEINGILNSLRQQLDYRKDIDLYVSDDVEGKAQLLSLLGHRLIIIDGGFANELKGEEYARLRFMMGSFVGALKDRHLRFTLLATLLDQLNKLKFASPLLNPYIRATIYTGDQIGYLCSGSLESSLAVLARYMVGKDMAPELSAHGILKQAALVQNEALPRYSQLLQGNPHLVNRYVNVIAFAARVRPTDYRIFESGLGSAQQELLRMLLRSSPQGRVEVASSS
ncbi:hypothetical protein [Streptomyces sp. Caat 7-52]|uniref:hypothetical protein n=1 Tax=Streptomyces sp. Caat 7-52 TaxID=2949637 RepID=UPI00203508CB|nr:hypothetical protein [Streptomyces sp. Caat 7-52]